MRETAFCVAMLLSIALVAPCTATPRRMNNMRASVGGCACEQTEWCEPVRKGASGVTWVGQWDTHSEASIDWEVVTTLVVPELQIDTVCLAHSKGASAHILVPLASLDTSSPSLVQARGADGIVVDVRMAMGGANANAVAQWLLALQALRSQGVSVGVLVPFSPSAANGRIHLPIINTLVKAADLVVVMGDGVRNNVFDRCVASSASASRRVSVGAQQYIDLGVSASVVTVALPWDGVSFPCESLANDMCVLALHPSMTALCTDNSASRVAVAQLEGMKERESQHEDAITRSHFFSYTDTANTTRQVWYDTPEDLEHKYASLVGVGIKGVGVIASQGTEGRVDSLRWGVVKDVLE